VGGQTALNLAKELYERGTLAKYNVELIGASLASIDLAEDRQQFKDAMTEIGLSCPPSEMVSTVEDAVRVANELTGDPCLIRTSLTRGGSGGGGASDAAEHRQRVDAGWR